MSLKFALESRRLGFVLVTASAVCWSTAGALVRAVNLDSATLLVYSAFSAFLGLGMVSALRLKGEFLCAVFKIGVPGLLYVATAAACTISYILALQFTSVANVMSIYAALPFIATAIAFFCLRERVSRRFIISGLISMGGVAITAGAAATTDDVMGLLAAFATTATFAAQLVLAKRYPGLDILLVTAIAAGASAVAATPFMAQDPLSNAQIVYCSLYGLVPYGLGTALALGGGRLIKSGEAGLVGLLDVVLGPLWVCLIFREQPSLPSLVGGAIVLGCVFWYLSNESKLLSMNAARS